MHPRHRLDIRAGDLLHGLAGCALARNADRLEADVLQRCGVTDRGLVTLSVRSAWDLLLSALDWPPGTEVLVSAITHPDMIVILQAHGLCPVPVDLDPDTLAPGPADLAAALSDRSRAIMIVSLFGGRIELGPITAFADRHGLLVFEDAAQAFTGPASLTGSAAQVSLYSFGMIKTATAGGGAIAVVRDPLLLARMRRRHRSWPAQSRRAYGTRLVKLAVLLLLARPRVYGTFFRGCILTAADPDAVISRITRSFQPAPGAAPDALLGRLRRRPSAALTALLRRRIATFDTGRLQRRAAAGEHLTTVLPPSVGHPGNRLGSPTHWLYPVVGPDPVGLVGALRHRGLDASRGTSNLTVVAGGSASTPHASRLMASIVYLPVYPELPLSAARRLVEGLTAVQ